MSAWESITFDEPGARAPRFGRPLRIGARTADVDEPWVGALEDEVDLYYEVVELDGRARACMILVLVGALDEFAASLRRVPVRAELVLWVVDEPPTRAQLGVVRRLARAGAVAAVTGREPDAAVNELVGRLDDGADLLSALAQLDARLLGATERLSSVELPPEDTAAYDTGESEPRHLQARARDGDENLSALAPATDFCVEVRVGPPSGEWLGLAEAMPTPSEPPPDASGWPLRVVFWDPLYAAKPLVEAMTLPLAGASEPVRFALRTADAAAEPLAARVTVLHQNEVLQTGVLRIPSAAEAGDAAPSFTVDAAPRPELGQVDEDRFFDASLVLNHDEGGTGRATVVQDEVVAVVALESEGLSKFTSLVDRYLSAIAKRPDDYEGLRAAGTVELLRNLAISGAGLHRRLLRDGALDPERFSGGGPLQVTASRADAFFPIEFLYRWRAPDEDAQLCEGAEDALGPDALARGACSAGCDGSQRDRVCPLGFWGLSRVLERHTFRARDARSMNVPFELRANDVDDRYTDLRPLTRVLVGASDIASKFDPEAVAKLVARLGELVPSHELYEANDWDAWEQQAKHDPSLLVLLPHHETRQNRDYLHIGKDSELLSSRIDEEHVGGAGGELAPIVLLIGCETTFAKIQFDDFVSAFRFAGAKVIVSTVATILGRHAAPAAQRLTELIDARTREGPIRVGEVLLAARRSLLAEGMPMALGLTAYGDADWRLAAAGD